MKNNDFNDLIRIARKLGEPENLFSGLLLPHGFALPDNILVFYHDCAAPTPNAHGRYTLVIPTADMTYFVEDRRLELDPGSVLLVPPFHMRYLHPKSRDYGRFFITFELPGRQDYLPSDFRSRLTPDGWTLLRRFLRRYERGEGCEAATALYALLTNLKGETIPLSGAPHFPRPVMAAIEFISRHMAEPIGNPETAEAAGVSESHLRALFRTHVGITPGQYLAHQRLDAAKHRLLHTAMKVEEIARSCGYRNIYVFSAFFRTHAGVSPLQFRRKNRVSLTTREPDEPDSPRSSSSLRD